MTAAAILGAWCLGVTTATVLAPAQPLLGALVLPAAPAAAVLALAVRPACLALAVAAALLGAARAELPAGDPAAAARAPALAGLAVVMQGEVVDDPRPTADGFELLVQPSAIAAAGGPRAPAGSVLVAVRGDGEPGLGDRVEVAGRLQLPRDQPGFDRRAYLAQRGCYLEIRVQQVRLLARRPGVGAFPGFLRDRYRQAVLALMPSPHAQLLIGVVLGVRAGIPPRLQQDLVATGLVHLLVLSGLKVAVFARLATAALKPLLGRHVTLPVVALIGVYALAGGATPAAVRAAVMGGLVLAADRLGRSTHVWTSLAATAAVMLALRPELAWDIGFQLSFSGTAAIVVLAPALERRLRRLPGAVREPLAVTAAAELGTLPFMAAGFHTVSLVAPLANAAVLPLLPAIVAAGLVLSPLALLPDLGRLLALPVVGLLAYLEQVAGLLARLPAGSVTAPPISPASGAAYYVALGAAVAAWKTYDHARLVAIVVGAVVPLCIGGAELAAWDRSAPAATVLAVGDGQAVLLAGPGGFALIDGGSSPARLKAALGTHLPPWRRHLDALLLTGPGLGHVGGLAGFDLDVAKVVVADGPPPGAAWRAVALAAAGRGATLVRAHAGQTLVVAGLEVRILSPEAGSPDPGQLALRVRGPSGHTFCDLADLAPEAQAAAAAWLPRGGCDALLVPSGGRSAPAPELLRSVAPGRLLVSDAGGGRLSRDLPPAAVSRTSQEGDVTVPL